MKIRDKNIIVCECGAELNPEITTENDFLKYDGQTVTCSNCGATQELILYENEVVDKDSYYETLCAIEIRKAYTESKEHEIKTDMLNALALGEEIPQSWIDFNAEIESIKDRVHLEVFGYNRGEEPPTEPIDEVIV